MITGTIKMFNHDRGFGFIKPDQDDGPDVFVHISGIISSATPREGMRVEFDIATDPKSGKPRASGVRIVG